MVPMMAAVPVVFMMTLLVTSGARLPAASMAVALSV